MRGAALLAGAALAAAPLAAQVADSAAAARAHWRLAGAALRAGDTATALDGARRAAAAWPAQPAYHAAVARVAALAGRPEDALPALERLATLGVAWRAEEPWAQSLAGDARYERVLARMRAATAPLARSTVLAELADTMLHPEAVVRDAPRRRWLVSSVRRRTIVALGDDGRVQPFPAPGTSLDAVLGLGIDAARGLLWAASTALPQQEGWAPGDSGRAALVAFDLVTGIERRRVAFPAGRAAGDIAVGVDGTVFVSDPRGALLALAPQATVPRELAGGPLLRSPQGILVRDGGRALLVADHAHGPLRVDLATGAVTPVPWPSDVTLLGLDGLVALPDGRVAAMQNGVAPPRVLALTLAPGDAAVTRVETLDRHLPRATEPTLGAVDGGRLVYVANSPWAAYDEDGVPAPGAAWPRPLLLAVPLR